MPKVIRTRNLISAGEVEIPDQVLPVPMEIPADPEEGAEAPEAQAVPQPDPEQTRPCSGRTVPQPAGTDADPGGGNLRQNSPACRGRAGAHPAGGQNRSGGDPPAGPGGSIQAAVEEKRQRIENLLGATEGLLNQLAQQQRQYFIRYEKALPDLALEIAGKVMEHAIQTDPLVLEPLVQRAVAQVKNAEWLEVQVSQQLPELAQELRKELQEWTDARHVEVTTDQNELGACVVHTPQGIIDASVSTQLDNLNKRLHTPARN